MPRRATRRTVRAQPTSIRELADMYEEECDVLLWDQEREEWDT